MIDASRAVRLGALGAGILLVAMLVGAGLVTADRASAEDGEPEGNLSVVITDGLEPTPTPTPTPTTTPTLPPDPTPPPRPGAVDQETITDPDEAEEALGDEPTDIGGILYMSGLTASENPNFAPGNGTLTLTFTVRNTSSTTFDSTAKFWITNAAGVRISKEIRVAVNDLEAGETRRVKATFGGLGQHTLLKGHVTLTPPKTVEGAKLSPLTRDTLIVLPPLFGLSVAGGLAGLFGILWWLVGPRGFGLIRFVGIARVGA